MKFRLIHTSDWHLGQHFFGKSRAPEHSAFLSWLLEQVQKHQVDAIVIAGDLFDIGSPPSYARELYNRFVVDVRQTGCQLVVLGGNHDSVATLNESRDLLAQLNTQVISGVRELAEEQVLVLNNRQGEPGAILCAVPYIRPRDVLLSQAGQSGAEKQQALQQAIAEHYEVLYDEAQRLKENLGLALPIIATGHLTTVGASTSESVRDIYIGTLDAFPASAFPPADYIALGHIHRPQRIAGTDHIRYSGSPIPLSFDETHQAKSVWLAEFEQGRLDRVEPLEVPCFQPMRVIRGSLEEIEQALAEIREQYRGEQPIWLDIEVSTQDYLNDLQRRIQELTAGLRVEVLLLRRERRAKAVALEQVAGETLAELTVEEVFERRLAQEQWESEDDRARLERLRQAFRQVVAEVTDDASSETRS